MKRKSRYLFLSIFLCNILLGCSPANEDNKNPETKTLHDTTPVVHEPKASGTSILGNDRIIFDVSNVKEGYVMVTYKGDNSKVKVRITNPDEDYPYNYDIIKKGYTVLPLTGKSGTYTFSAYENISDNRYSTLFSGTYKVTLKNEYTAFLYPSQLVNFHKQSNAVQIGEEVARGAKDDLEVVSKIYSYIIKNIAYDDAKAENVKQGKLNGYLSEVDKTLADKKGICFDYAALMATMLRSQRIPTRMLFGYTTMNKETFYHAWIGVYIKDVGWIDNIIEFDGTSWSMMDPTLASENKNSKTIKDFISNKHNYQEKYMY